MKNVLSILLALFLVGCVKKTSTATAGDGGLAPVPPPVVSPNDEVQMVQVGNTFRPLVKPGEEAAHLPQVEYSGVSN